MMSTVVELGHSILNQAETSILYHWVSIKISRIKSLVKVTQDELDRMDIWHP